MEQPDLQILIWLQGVAEIYPEQQMMGLLPKQA